MNDASVEEIGWKEISESIRIQISKYACKIPAMGVEEVQKFVDTARQALWLEQDALTFTKEIELKNQRVWNTE